VIVNKNPGCSLHPHSRQGWIDVTYWMWICGSTKAIKTVILFRSEKPHDASKSLILIEALG
jgi:hypothetical protein